MSDAEPPAGPEDAEPPAGPEDADSGTDADASSDTDVDSGSGVAADVKDVDGPVVLFDGVCKLCHAGIRSIVRLDGRRRVRFAPLQSDVGRALLARHGLSTDYFDSMVLVEDGEAYTDSTAVLRICRHLDGPLPLLYPLVYLPESLRDGVYDLVADYRYRVFGRKERCSVPDERIRERFLDGSLG
jgi:predicted DCC family thiol-disulfide oxidoreductase YuxK